MSDHGPLYDSFPAQSGHDHDSSYFDIFDGREQGDKHGPLFDDNFRASHREAAHGNLWDGFEWKAMPVLHGTRFDESFSEPSALSGVHGSWFDAFRGGAVARFVLDGADFEGQVIDCNDEYATVKTRQGQTVEVGFPQFLSYASPNMHQAGPATTVVHSPGQEAPRTEVADPYAPMESVTLAVKALRGEIDVAKAAPDGLAATPAAHTVEDNPFNRQHAGHLIGKSFCARHAPSYTKLGPAKPSALCDHAGCGGSVRYGAASTAKSSRSALDVAKVGVSGGGAPSVGTSFHSTCPSCKAPGGAMMVGTKHEHVGAPVASGKATCVHCGAEHPMQGTFFKTAPRALDVLKEMNSQETAAQGDPDDGEGGHWCEHCKHTCRKSEDGKCPTCGHEVVAKSWESSVLTGGADIPLREGAKASDHHMRLGQRFTRCPHCGGVHELNDEQTEQGQPSRKERQGADEYDEVATRKCIPAALDIFKEAWA